MAFRHVFVPAAGTSLAFYDILCSDVIVAVKSSTKVNL